MADKAEMIDTNNSVAAVKEKDALKAHSAEQRRCRNGHKYLFPDIMYPDAGGIFDTGIVGKHRIEPMAVCPECRVKI